MKLAVRVDFLEVQRALERLGARDANAAINRSINRAATTLKAETAREVAKSYRIRIGALKDRAIRVEKSSRSTLAADVRITGQAIPLAEYGNPKESKKGVRVTVRRGGKRTLYPRSFIARGAGGKPQVFWRTKGDGPTGLVPRGPLRVLLGPSVAQVVSAPRFVAKLQDVGFKRMVETLRQEVRFRLSKRKI